MTSIAVQISGLDKWQRVALASMCTMSLAPLVTRLAKPATRHAFAQGLDAAWNSVRDGVPHPCVLSVRSTLGDLTESTCDDSNVLAYDVMRAIGALACTLDAIESQLGQPAIDACAGVTEVFAAYDHVLVHGEKTLRIDPRNPPPPGRLEALLVHAQLAAIDAMRTAGCLADHAMGIVRSFGCRLAIELERALPAYVEQRGWTP